MTGNAPWAFCVAQLSRVGRNSCPMNKHHCGSDDCSYEVGYLLNSNVRVRLCAPIGCPPTRLGRSPPSRILVLVTTVPRCPAPVSDLYLGPSGRICSRELMGEFPNVAARPWRALPSGRDSSSRLLVWPRDRRNATQWVFEGRPNGPQHDPPAKKTPRS
jgi:hypothetical protein